MSLFTPANQKSNPGKPKTPWRGNGNGPSPFSREFKKYLKTTRAPKPEQGQ